MKPQPKSSISGGLDIVGDAPKAPLGAIGGDYGDFFPRGWRLGRRIREYSLFRDNFPLSIFQFLFSFFYLNCLLVLL